MRRLGIAMLIALLLSAAQTFGQGASGNKKACHISIESKTKQTSCVGALDGQIQLIVQGGVPPLRISWSDGGEGPVREGLLAGMYVVDIQDAAGCNSRKQIAVEEGNALSESLNITSVPVAGKGASVKILFADGTKPLAVKVKDLSQGYQAPWQNYSGNTLSAGSYLLEAFTAAGCSKIERIRVAAN